MKYPRSSYVFNGHKVTITWIKTDSIKNFKPVTQAYGVCFNNKGEILICREGPEGKWGLPGGKPEAGETIEKTLKREFIEEVDVKIKNIKVLGAQKVEFPDNPNKKEGKEFYQVRCVCEVEELLPQTPDPANGKVWKRTFVPTKQITKYIKWGKTGEVMFRDAIQRSKKYKEDTRRKHFHINNEIYKSKIPNIKIKSDSYFTVRQTLINLGFIEVHTPTITTVPTDPVRNDPNEEIFSVNWYGRKMFLRQSNQLYKQILALSGMDKLFELGPFWRAEQNPTPRHLSEAYGLDIEMTGVTKLNELINLLQTLLHEITLKLYQEEKILENQIISDEIKTITYEEALDFLNSKDSKNKVNYGIDFGYDLEERLGKIMLNKYNTNLFAIIKYPSSIKKFYTKRVEDDKTLSFDVIYKGWEIVSGAIRETDYEKLLKGIKETGLKYEKYQFYLNAFQNPKPHGGFCLGIDRFLVKLLDLNSLSDLFLFPRSEYDIIP